MPESNSGIMRALVIHADERVRDSVENILREAAREPLAVRHAASPTEGLGLATWFAPRLVFLELTGERELAVQAARALRKQGRVIFGLYNPLLLGGGVEELRRAARAGVTDFLPLPLGEGEMVEALEAVSEMRGPVVGSEGTTLAFVGPKGGVGVSQIAVNAGVVLAGSGVMGEAALFDSVLPFGSAAGYLGVDFDRDWSESVAGGVAEDAVIEALIEETRTGLKVLAPPPEPLAAEALTADTLCRALLSLRRRFGVVVVDVSSVLDHRALSVLDLAELVFVVTEGVAPTVRATGAYIRLLQDLGFTPDRLRLVLNTRSPGPDHLSKPAVADALERIVDHEVPFESAAVGAANNGVPLLLQKEGSAFADAIRGIVEDGVQSLITLRERRLTAES